MRKPTLSGRLFFFLSPRPAPAGPAEPVHNWPGTWPSIWLGKADPDKCDEAPRAAQLKPSSEPLELIGDVRFVSEEAAALTNLTIRSAADLQTGRSGRFGKILVSNLSGAAWWGGGGAGRWPKMAGPVAGKRPARLAGGRAKTATKTNSHRNCPATRRWGLRRRLLAGTSALGTSVPKQPGRTP